MVPVEVVSGFEVRPGMYELNGAMAIPVGVNFTVHSFGATSCELLLFHRKLHAAYRLHATNRVNEVLLHFYPKSIIPEGQKSNISCLPWRKS